MEAEGETEGEAEGKRQRGRQHDGCAHPRRMVLGANCLGQYKINACKHMHINTHTGTHTRANASTHTDARTHTHTHTAATNHLAQGMHHQTCSSFRYCAVQLSTPVGGASLESALYTCCVSGQVGHVFVVLQVLLAKLGIDERKVVRMQVQVPPQAFLPWNKMAQAGASQASEELAQKSWAWDREQARREP